MGSGTVQVEVPAELAQLLDPTGADVAGRVREALVLQLFHQGAISSGKGAELLGMSKDDFRALLHERGIPYFQQTIAEVLQDAEVAASARADRHQ